MLELIRQKMEDHFGLQSAIAYEDSKRFGLHFISPTGIAVFGIDFFFSSTEERWMFGGTSHIINNATAEISKMFHEGKI